MTGASLLDGLLTLAVGLALLVSYLEVFRAAHPEQTAKEMAFELIEGDVVTHSRGLNVLLDDRGRCKLLPKQGFFPSNADVADPFVVVRVFGGRLAGARRRAAPSNCTTR